MMTIAPAANGPTSDDPVAPVLAKGASLAEQAYGFLKGNIISLQYPPGSPLLENQLAKQLGISRSPMREALARLEREGFIEIVPWKGARVREINLKQITDLYQVRICLEGMAARLAVPNLDRRELETVRAAMNELAPRVEQGDILAFYEHDVVFHDLYVANCGNDLLISSLAGIRDHIQRIRNFLSANSVSGQHEYLSLGEHQAALQAFQTGSGEAAERAVRTHLEKILERVAAVL
ncbi:MAG TPA: GntR family transcriptional regulator [Chloroflexota bacterium]